MPKFAANLTMLFNEVPFLDRFEAASKAGFRGVEYLFPYDFKKEELAERLRRYNLVQALHNLPAGNWAGGERGIACLPDRKGEFQESVGKAIEYARVLGCKTLNCLAGKAPQGADPAKVRETLVANLRYAAAETARAGIRLITEPINNRVDIPGFYLNNTAQALSIIKDVDHPNLGLQYDIYHMQVMEGDLARTMEANKGLIWHIQVADNPGRNEPGTGEINYPFLFAFLDRIGYAGWIGCEYKPAKGTAEGLKWFAPYKGK